MATKKEEVLKIYVEDKNLKNKYIDHIEDHNLRIKDPYADSGFDILSSETQTINHRTTSNKIDFNIKTAFYAREPVEHELNYLQAAVYSGSLMGLCILLNQAILGFYLSLLIGGILILNENNHLLEISENMYVEHPLPFILLPRSSTGKNTPLRLSNSMGVIDKGYRGNIKAYVDNVDSPVDYEEVETGDSKKIHEDSYTIKQFDKLFQVVSYTGNPIKVELVNELEELSKTTRGENGFGSTNNQNN
jgi:dUTPase